jgi:predicted Ser/Thr protein kinase
LLIERGLATQEQVSFCVKLQQARARAGDFTRIGTIMVEQRVVTPAQVAEVLKDQQITILICIICKSQYNIHNYAKNQYYECRKCHGPLKKPSSLDSLIIQDTMRPRQSKAAPGKSVKATKPKASALDTIVAPHRKAAKVQEDMVENLDLEGLEARKIGDYEILGEIARGGMGVIYKARQLALDRDVALKTLNAEEARRDDAVERFQREAQAIASLRHANLVAVHTVDRYHDIHFFTMEFVEGIPLDGLLKKETSLGEDHAVEILLPIIDALEYAHKEGVVHRDLKPANIIIDVHDTPFLVDFGIAKRKGDRQLTETGEILGSVPYMAPEYIMGDEYTEACDVYSVGICLYEALSGFENLPFGSDIENIETVRLLKRIAYESPEPIRTHCPDIDPLLEQIVMKSITRDLQVRYNSAGNLAADLRAWLEGRRKAQVVVNKVPAWVWLIVVVIITLLMANVGIMALAAKKQMSFRGELRITFEKTLLEIGRLERVGQTTSAANLRKHLKELCVQEPWLQDFVPRLNASKKEAPTSQAADKKKPGIEKKSAGGQ